MGNEEGLLYRKLKKFTCLSGFLLTTRSHPWGAAASGSLGWWPSADPAIKPTPTRSYDPVNNLLFLVFFFKQKTAYEITTRLVGSEMCIRDRSRGRCDDVWCLCGIVKSEFVFSSRFSHMG